jgi:hypothetical protein
LAKTSCYLPTISIVDTRYSMAVPKTVVTTYCYRLQFALLMSDGVQRYAFVNPLFFYALRMVSGKWKM